VIVGSLDCLGTIDNEFKNRVGYEALAPFSETITNGERAFLVLNAKID
jgi:hypothetical protein